MAQAKLARKRLKPMGKKINRALTHEWDQLVQSMPVDLDASARQYGALARRRQIKRGADLLRLNLIYALSLSLTVTVLWGSACS